LPEQPKDWAQLWSIIEVGVALLEFEPFLDDTLADDKLAAFRKAIVEAEAATASLDKLAFSMEMAKAKASSVRATLAKRVSEFIVKNSCLLHRGVADAREAMQQALTMLLPTAYGTKDDQAWSAKLKAKSTIDEIVELAAGSGLLGMNMKPHDAATTGLNVSVDIMKAAIQPQGGIATGDEDLERAEAMWLRGLLTSVEAELVRASPCVDKDAQRSLVQEAIRQLREQTLKENELLPSCSYRWPKGVLTAR